MVKYMIYALEHILSQCDSLLGRLHTALIKGILVLQTEVEQQEGGWTKDMDPMFSQQKQESIYSHCQAMMLD